MAQKQQPVFRRADIRSYGVPAKPWKPHGRGGSGGTVVVFADGWVEDRTHIVAEGFWIHDLEVETETDPNGREVVVDKWVTLHLKEEPIFTLRGKGSHWKPIAGIRAPQTKHYLVPTNKTAGKLAEFWQQHALGKPNKKGVTDITATANVVVSDRPVEELMQARRNGSSA